MVVLTFDISNRETISGLRAVRSQPYPDAWADGFGYSDLWQWRNDITRYFQYGYGEKIPVLMLGLKRDLRVVNESIIYPQEVRMSVHYGMQWNKTNWIRHTVSLKNCSVIDMLNARLSRGNCSRKPLKISPGWQQ